MNLKTCARCKELKEPIQFKPNPKSKDGLDSWCVPCYVQYRIEYKKRDKNFRKQISFKEGYKICRKCNQEKEFNLFAASIHVKDGLNSWCKECVKNYQKQRPKTQNSNRNDHKTKTTGTRSLVPTKTCPGCKKCLPLTKEFWNVNKRRNGQFGVWCKECRRLKDRSRHQNRNRREKIYGIKEERFIEMLNNANNQCQICHVDLDNSTQRRPNIDHCHKTGFIRGILCVRCNSGLGQMKDSIVILKSAIDYLEKAEQNYNKRQNVE